MQAYGEYSTAVLVMFGGYFWMHQTFSQTLWTKDFASLCLAHPCVCSSGWFVWQSGLELKVLA